MYRKLGVERKLNYVKMDQDHAKALEQCFYIVLKPPQQLTKYGRFTLRNKQLKTLASKLLTFENSCYNRQQKDSTRRMLYMLLLMNFIIFKTTSRVLGR